MIDWHSMSGRRLIDQIVEVIEPIARDYSGGDIETIEAELRRRWRAEIGTRLPACTVRRCAEAISKGEPRWWLSFWSVN